MRQVLAPHVGEEDGAFLRVQLGDGEADIYIHDGGMMANRISGHDPCEAQPMRSASETMIPSGPRT